MDTSANYLLYECCVDLGANIITFPDWNVAKPSGIVRVFAKTGKLNMFKCEVDSFLEQINDIQDSDESTARKLISDKLRELGISAISYPNEHEEKDRELSYCLVDGLDAEVLNYQIVDRILKSSNNA